MLYNFKINNEAYNVFLHFKIALNDVKYWWQRK